jgi:hypothetical protein
MDASAQMWLTTRSASATAEAACLRPKEAPSGVEPLYEALQASA